MENTFFLGGLKEYSTNNFPAHIFPSLYDEKYQTNISKFNRQPIPVFPEVGVLAMVPDDWNSPWQTRHYVLKNLSQYFHVVWCNPGHSWRQILSPKARPGPFSAPLSSLSSQFFVYSPEKWLPTIRNSSPLYLPLMKFRLERAKKFLLARGCKKIILYMWRPEFSPLMDLIQQDLACYHIDDEYSFAQVEVPTSSEESRLISRVDQVIVSSFSLFEKKGHLNRHTLVVNNGVDYQAFATPRAIPEELKNIPNPRIGYIGIIKNTLNLEMMFDLARENPQWSFVFVGPQKNLKVTLPLTRKLSMLSNVYFLGEKDPEEVPAYMQHVDVSLLCYKMNDYTKYIYPLKLHQSLAAGRPTVGTPIESIKIFSPFVGLASTKDEWRQAIVDSINSPPSLKEILLRQEIAKLYDWSTFAKDIARVLAIRLNLF